MLPDYWKKKKKKSPAWFKEQKDSFKDFPLGKTDVYTDLFNISLVITVPTYLTQFTSISVGFPLG